MTPPSPTPAEVKAARLAAGQSQTQAANTVYCCLRTWQKYEHGDLGIPQAIWELWNIKIGRMKCL